MFGVKILTFSIDAHFLQIQIFVQALFHPNSQLVLILKNKISKDTLKN